MAKKSADKENVSRAHWTDKKDRIKEWMAEKALVLMYALKQVWFLRQILGCPKNSSENSDFTTVAL
jgi:hypothetical protein